MDRSKYPADWPKISARIRERAGNQCEQCGAPNRVLIARGVESDLGTYMLPEGEVRSDVDGSPLGFARGSEYSFRFVKIVLTVAHVNHDTTDNTDDNLRAWCQMCHLRNDRELHTRHSKETRRQKRTVGQGSLKFPSG